MSFVKTFEELEKLKRDTFNFYGAEFLIVYWETKPEIVEKLLPPPLNPVKHPVATAFIANYPKTNFGVSYQEGAIFLFAEYGGITGIYCLAMPVNNDMALIGGRENFGYPKKMATISFKKSEKEAEGWIERHGIKFFEIKAALNNKLNAKDAMKILMELGLNPQKPGSTAYNFKYFRDPCYTKFDYHPRLVREELTMQSSEMKLGQIEITLTPSKYDPWSEISVERILGGFYMKADSQMQPGEIVAEVENEVEFLKYAYGKIDPFE